MRLMLLGCVVLIALARPVESEAAASACAPYTRPITIDFKTETPSPIYNNRLTVAGIRNLFSQHTEAVTGPHQRALGITYVQTAYGLEGSSTAIPRRGGHCVYLTKVDAELGWKRMEIYVASEFQPGTCQYRAVLDHENQHVAINRAVLKEFAPQFRATLERVLAEQQPIFTQNPKGASDAALIAVNRRLSAAFDQFQTTLAARHAPIDSANNYGEIAKLCNQWDGISPPPQQQRRR